VTWTGRRPAADVSRILGAADVFVAPFDGGASLRRSSLMAGLAHGLPVVTTSPAVPSPYLRDGDNIALVPPRDAAALAARLAALLAAPAARTRLAEGARKLAARVAWPAIAEETRAVYRRVLV
jgi:glycosyltransferase involved in cell wall biosynthesis